MSEEAKEILFQLEIVARKHTIKVTDTGNAETMPASVVDELRLNNYSAKILLNYITNLQKENTDLKKLCDKYEEEHNTAFKLWKENMEKIPPFDKFLDYKQRNKKAIEFVKSMEYCGQEDYFYDLKSKDPCGNDNTFNDSKYNLLNILEGGDE